MPLKVGCQPFVRKTDALDGADGTNNTDGANASDAADDTDCNGAPARHLGSTHLKTGRAHLVGMEMGMPMTTPPIAWIAPTRAEQMAMAGL